MARKDSERAVARRTHHSQAPNTRKRRRRPQKQGAPLRPEASGPGGALPRDRALADDLTRPSTVWTPREAAHWRGWKDSLKQKAQERDDKQNDRQRGGGLKPLEAEQKAIAGDGAAVRAGGQDGRSGGQEAGRGHTKGRRGDREKTRVDRRPGRRGQAGTDRLPTSCRRWKQRRIRPVA